MSLLDLSQTGSAVGASGPSLGESQTLLTDFDLPDGHIVPNGIYAAADYPQLIDSASKAPDVPVTTLTSVSTALTAPTSTGGAGSLPAYQRFAQGGGYTVHYWPYSTSTYYRVSNDAFETDNNAYTHSSVEWVSVSWSEHHSKFFVVSEDDQCFLMDPTDGSISALSVSGFSDINLTGGCISDGKFAAVTRTSAGIYLIDTDALTQTFLDWSAFRPDGSPLGYHVAWYDGCFYVAFSASSAANAYTNSVVTSVLKYDPVAGGDPEIVWTGNTGVITALAASSKGVFVCEVYTNAVNGSSQYRLYTRVVDIIAGRNSPAVGGQYYNNAAALDEPVNLACIEDACVCVCPDTTDSSTTNYSGYLPILVVSIGEAGSGVFRPSAGGLQISIAYVSNSGDTFIVGEADNNQNLDTHETNGLWTFPRATHFKLKPEIRTSYRVE